MENEYILCSAIHYLDGEEHPFQPKNVESGTVVCGYRHCDCLQTRVLQAIPRYIAFNAKQIDVFKFQDSKQLYSEDLYRSAE